MKLSVQDVHNSTEHLLRKVVKRATKEGDIYRVFETFDVKATEAGIENVGERMYEAFKVIRY